MQNAKSNCRHKEYAYISSISFQCQKRFLPPFNSPWIREAKKDFQICSIINLVGSLFPGARVTTQEVRVCLVTLVMRHAEAGLGLFAPDNTGESFCSVKKNRKS